MGELLLVPVLITQCFQGPRILYVCLGNKCYYWMLGFLSHTLAYLLQHGHAHFQHGHAHLHMGTCSKIRLQQLRKKSIADTKLLIVQKRLDKTWKSSDFCILELQVLQYCYVVPQRNLVLMQVQTLLNLIFKPGKIQICNIEHMYVASVVSRKTYSILMTTQLWISRGSFFFLTISKKYYVDFNHAETFCSTRIGWLCHFEYLTQCSSALASPPVK